MGRHSTLHRLQLGSCDFLYYIHVIFPSSKDKELKREEKMKEGDDNSQRDPLIHHTATEKETKFFYPPC